MKTWNHEKKKNWLPGDIPASIPSSPSKASLICTGLGSADTMMSHSSITSLGDEATLHL